MLAKRRVWEQRSNYKPVTILHWSISNRATTLKAKQSENLKKNMNLNAIDWHTLIPGLVAGLLTGGFAILAQFFATLWTYENNMRLAGIQSQKRMTAILQAIKYDFEVAYEIFYRKAGKELEKLEDGKPFRNYFSVPDKWLIVYPNHTEIIGQMDDKDLCKAIIQTYNEANYVIDGMRVNNWYLDRLTEYQKRVAENLPGDHARMNLQSYEKLLVDFAPGLKEGNKKLKEWKDTLSAKIDNYLASH